MADKNFKRLKKERERERFRRIEIFVVYELSEFRVKDRETTNIFAIDKSY